MENKMYSDGLSKSSLSWSARMSDSVMARDPILPFRWSYDYGVVFKGMEQVWLASGDRKYLDYIKRNMDEYVGPDGAIKGYSMEEYNIDYVNNGKILLLLYRQTGQERYRKAAETLRRQLEGHPRTTEGGFWHKKIYPRQMWLDGIYMGVPFYAEFARLFGGSADFDDAAKQILLIAGHARDPGTGLYYHGWDESRGQKWSNPETGCSPNFWGRAEGWFMMAVADVLDFLPTEHKDRGGIVELLKELISAVGRVQDKETGLWYQVLDRGGSPGNYPEASASCMFVYGIAKAAAMGYIGREEGEVAIRGFGGILDRFVETDADGLVSLTGTCEVAGLGGDPYRDGTYDYYIHERIKRNDLKGIGAFILAATQVEKLAANRDSGVSGR
jgi:unsaturated rhamnogalacturonyl hydrolase